MAPVFRFALLRVWLMLAAEGVHLEAPAPDGVAKVKGRSPSIFCFMVAIPPERWLVRTHIQEQMLAGCDAYSVYTNVSADTYFGFPEEVPANFGGLGMMYGNKPGKWYDIVRHMDVGHWNLTGVMKQVWKHMLRMRDFEAHDWVVKVDPDTVFSPDRLRALLLHRNYTGPSILGSWGEDCMLAVGAIVVVTKDAMQSFGEVMDACNDEFGSEDVFFSFCLTTHTRTVMRPEPLLIQAWHLDPSGTWMVASHGKGWPDDVQDCVDSIMGVGPAPDFEAEPVCSTYVGPSESLLRQSTLRRAHDVLRSVLLRRRDAGHMFNTTSVSK